MVHENSKMTTFQISRFKDVISVGSCTETTLKEMMEFDYIHQIFKESDLSSLLVFYEFIVQKHKEIDKETQKQRKQGISFNELDSAYRFLLIYCNTIDLLKKIIFQNYGIKV
jgi:hypothetical protein